MRRRTAYCVLRNGTQYGIRNTEYGLQQQFKLYPAGGQALVGYIGGQIMANKLWIIPLGGLGEVGKNMMVLEYGKNIIIIDAGIMFPENDMLGIDFIIPDFNYLMDKKDIVRGIILTHGHEDHVGALPYVLKEIRAPIYTTG